MESVKCCLEGCSTMVRTTAENPVCTSHRYRKRMGNFGPVRVTAETCSFEGCSHKPRSRALCPAHYRQQLQGRELRPLYEAPKRRHTANGYIELYMPGAPGTNKTGRIMEHRHVMQQALGRTLVVGENVHHRNGRRDDNRLENLELWVSSQPSGQRVEDVVAHAVEMLARYAPERVRSASPR